MKKKILTFIIALSVAMSMAPAALADDVQPDQEQIPQAEQTAAGSADQDTPAATEATGTDQVQAGSQAAPAATEDQDQKTEVVTRVVKQKIKLQIVVRGKATGKGTIKVKWNKISGSRGYYVYRATSRNGKYRKVYTTAKSSKTSWTDKSRKLKRNRNYYYKVYPRNKKALVKTRKTVVRVTKSTASVKTASAAPTSDSTKAKVKNTIRARKCMTVKTTAYSGGGLCANGKRCAVGRVAVDPRVIKLGTWLYIDGYGLAQACDTGGAIKGRKVDLYFNGGERNCYKYGVRKVKLFILK
ncbi:MAG: 3D domain-containing protein [Anaerovoracaceae bacterium]|jgi:3D (Asp-Asp-Asp) domain-containing protein